MDVKAVEVVVDTAREKNTAKLENLSLIACDVSDGFFSQQWNQRWIMLMIRLLRIVFV